MRTGRVVVPAVLLLSLSASHPAQAQPRPERLEVAVNLSLLRVSDFGHTLAPGESFGKVWIRSVIGFGL